MIRVFRIVEEARKAASLEGEKKALIERHLRLAYLAGGQDGPRSFAATAWAVRGVR